MSMQNARDIDARVIDLNEEEVRQARGTPPAEKLIAGARLFDYACAVMMAGIRRQYPQASDDQILQIVRERLEWAGRWG
jgi:hypothetical protein